MLIRSSTPQGTVLSPDFYNFNVNYFPVKASNKPSLVDDFARGENFLSIPTPTAALNEDLTQLAKWAKDKKVTIAPNKSDIILFTPDQKQYHTHPQVFLDGVLIPLDQKLKWLGVYHDPKINFGNHNSASCVKSNSRVTVMALAGTDYGHDMETLLLTYKALIRPTFTFGLPIWYPNTCSTNIKKLQTIQNKGLRIATGCHLKIPIAQLHTETKVLSVKNHLEMLNSQFMDSAKRRSHCLHDIVKLPPGPRKMKKTLYEANIKFVEPYLRHGVIPEVSYKQAIKSIHSVSVAAAICENGPNTVLGRYLYSYEPNIKEDRTLLQKTRCTIRQLRSGKCIRLQTYLHSIGKANDALCPLCRSAEHSTHHLFECASFPTNLSV
jgi:hypothetical protein